MFCMAFCLGGLAAWQVELGMLLAWQGGARLEAGLLAIGAQLLKEIASFSTTEPGWLPTFLFTLFWPGNVLLAFYLLAANVLLRFICTWDVFSTFSGYIFSTFSGL